MAASTTSGIAVDELSDEVRPQDDLFRYVNSRWLATTEIPPDRAAHGTFHMLHDQAELDVRPWPRRRRRAMPPRAATSARSAISGPPSWTSTP